MGAGTSEPEVPRDPVRSSTARLTTPRLLVEPVTREDLPAVVAYRSLPEVAALQSWSSGYTLDDAEGLLSDPAVDTLSEPGAWVQWALRLRGAGNHGVDTSTLVGDLGTGNVADQPDTYELGVTLDPAFQGVGLATEAVIAVTDWLMEARGAHRLVLHMDARNRSMIALAERLGWRHEGAAVDGDWFEGEWTTLHRYALLRGEWQKARPHE